MVTMVTVATPDCSPRSSTFVVTPLPASVVARLPESRNSIPCACAVFCATRSWVPACASAVNSLIA